LREITPSSLGIAGRPPPPPLFVEGTEALGGSECDVDRIPGAGVDPFSRLEQDGEENWLRVIADGKSGFSSHLHHHDDTASIHPAQDLLLTTPELVFATISDGFSQLEYD
jgi:hypothetical protein